MIELESKPGEHINSVAARALSLAATERQNVGFTFNGTPVVAKPDGEAV